ncbi:inositol-1,4,5-trisphosphate 5-phosphatase 2, related [Neospora caninum Liverpool]|uniref:Inositol-1,4,5-trisphosphate 5-phosphatase 2, related n=1 Tax=Neospora caninum (strain Liverpool) TaxID=572307 RepID=F0V725_NEOCL|nr:inositol-1,4,5-trisphosphate 5-phosphatase 2, related [Neospora caninum Liverpool]CBZ49516.1 inositol-1,4,5-trisphosphate 5-phosphatase 2, related [Neospora caninum Liverpool]CEL64095.1 TPA: Inositol-1,4,5-trisphosphate 5-phosphatase 2, related [Neospora caninum Liverpool]|eukprot:XP_003879551.1 inositol-1,4,5-trisphosphate 5-phosphatase 2, related [Neospora caninum Liverpool]
MACEDGSTREGSTLDSPHAWSHHKRQSAELPECGLANLVVDALFPDDDPDAPSAEENEKAEAGANEHLSVSARGRSGPVGTRWECRVVTPIIAASVDCFSAEGCGVVICEQPYSLFTYFNCCEVEYPPRGFGGYGYERISLRQYGSQMIEDEESERSQKRKSRPDTPNGDCDEDEELTKKTEKEPEIIELVRPKPGQDNRDKNATPIKIFVGTWNTEYQEFERHGPKPEERFCKTAKSLLDGKLKKDGARRISKDESYFSGHSTVHDVDTSSEGHDVVTLHINGEESDNDDVMTAVGEEEDEEEDGGEKKKNTSHLLKFNMEGHPLRDWIKAGYDVYVVTLQEVTNDSIFQAISEYLENENGEAFLRVDMGEGKISGLGKGAWTKMKSTSLACWIRESKLWPVGPIMPVDSKAFSFTVLNGSKGAVTVTLKVHKQLVCFVGCHLPASTKERGKARAFIRAKIAAMYSSEKNVDFTRVFHHILWAGDFNFRSQISSKRALELLRSGETSELATYDEGALESGKDMEMHGWMEAPVTFLPTYKKADNRPPLDMSQPDWVDKEYQVTMKKKGMLGTKTVDRPPSWCDRIFRWSLQELQYNLIAPKEEYFAAQPESPNILMASDHAPVGGGFELYPLDKKYQIPLTFMADPSEGLEAGDV